MDNESTYLFCRSQMDPDEQVLWRGRPDSKSLYMPKYELMAFCFGVGIALVTSAVLIFAWIVNGSEPLIVAFTIAFPLAGLSIAGIELKRAIQRRDCTEYVITNKRIFRRIGISIEVFSEGIAEGYETILRRNGNAVIRFPMVIDPKAERVWNNNKEIIQTFSLANITEVEAAQKALAHISAPSA